MAQIGVDIGEYTFAPGASGVGTITFTDVTIDRIEQLSPIINGKAPAESAQIFNPAIKRLGTLAGNVLTLEFNTAGQDASDPLWICFNQPGTVQSFGDQVSLGNLPGREVVQMAHFNQNLGKTLEDIGDHGILYELPYTGQTTNFTAGLVITGGTSNATATIVQDIDGGATGTLTVRNITGTFVAETITDTGGGDGTITGEPAKVLSLGLPTSGEQWEIFSENTNDDLAGTGCRLLVVQFMEEATGLYITEVVATGGHTPVSFASSDAFRFRSAICIAFGSATHPVMVATNLGTILIRESTTKAIRGLVTLDTENSSDIFGFNASLNSNYTIPSDREGVSQIFFGDTPKGEDAILRPVLSIDGGDSWFTLAGINSYQASTFEDFSNFPQTLPPLTDIKVVGRSTNDGVSVNSQSIFILSKIT